MANLLIKPTTGSGNKLILQDQDGGDAIEIADTGTTLTAPTLAGEATASGNLTVTGDFIPSTPLSHRNMVINGAMNVAQRGTSSTSAGYRTVDRMGGDFGYVAITQSQETLTTGSPYDNGFRKSIKHLTTNNVTTAATYFSTEYRIEAQDIVGSGWNYTSASSYITLSFWVKISPAGTYHTMVRTEDGTKYWYAKQYTVSADTWTKVEMSVPGNSNLTINNDNGKGLSIYPFIAYGTNYSVSGGTEESWTAYSGSLQTFESSGVPTWLNTTSAYVEFTGVQLELGSNATPFEHRTFQDDYLACQRYYYVIASHRQYIAGRTSNTNAMYCAPSCPVRMRSTPSIGNLGNFNIDCIHSEGGATSLNSTPTIDTYPTDGMGVGNTVGNIGLFGGSGLTDGRVCCARINEGLTFNAEL